MCVFHSELLLHICNNRYASITFTVHVTITFRQLGYDLLAEPSLVPAESLLPARPLQWNISAESAKDIQLAMVNNDK